MKLFLNKTLNFCKNYLKSINWIFLIGLALFCIVLAIINNIRVEESHSVEWIGSQEILEKPAEIL